MSAIDWAIIAVYLIWIVWDGIRLSQNTDKLEGYLLASKSLPWWAVGLSVMATQLSAITMVSSTGPGLCRRHGAVAAVLRAADRDDHHLGHVRAVFPARQHLHRLRVLERRFDAKTRSFTALLFLISRGMSTGVVISAPAVVLSVMIGADISTICVLLAVPTAIYTMYGGVQAVAWTDVKQMYLIVGGLLAAPWPAGPRTARHGQHRRGHAHRRHRGQAARRSTSRPTRPSDLRSGPARSARCSCSCRTSAPIRARCSATSPPSPMHEARTSLYMSAYWKIPLQALVMIIGVLMFVFYLFTPPPMLFNNVHDKRVRAKRREPATTSPSNRSSKPRSPTAATRRSSWPMASAATPAPTSTNQERVHRRRAERQGGSRRGRRAGQGGDRRSTLQRRQLRVSDLHRHAAAGRSGRLADGGDLRRRDVDDRRRAVGAVDCQR